MTSFSLFFRNTCCILILSFVFASNVFGNYVNVKDYGALGNGTTDDSDAFQLAHDALGADGGTIFVPATPVNYLISKTVIFTKPVRLLGEGWYGSLVLTRTNGIKVFSTNRKLDVENMSFTALDSAQTTSTFIYVQANSTGHGHSSLKNNYFLHGKYAYETDSANAFVIDGCKFHGYEDSALFLKNLNNSDIGDNYIINSVFSAYDNSIGIKAPSTAGLYICNNKFLYEKSHILINSQNNLVGNNLICNNSFEGHTDDAINLSSTTGCVTKTIITGNQFSSDTINHIVIGNKASNTVIQGNTFNNGVATEGTGILIQAGAENVTITGNAFHRILNGIIADDQDNAGLTINANRFANDVTTLFSGEAGVNDNASNKKITFTKFISYSDSVSYKNILKISGHAVVEIKIHGIVQGVGRSTYYMKKMISGTASCNLINPKILGTSFDVQLSPSSSGYILGMKKAPGIGTSITMYVSVTVDGQVSKLQAL